MELARRYLFPLKRGKLVLTVCMERAPKAVKMAKASRSLNLEMRKARDLEEVAKVLVLVKAKALLLKALAKVMAKGLARTR